MKAETTKIPAEADNPRHWLPDFCSLPVLGALLLVAELVFLAIELAPDEASWPHADTLLIGSLFVQWLAMCCALALCKLRTPLTRMAPVLAPVLAYLAVLVITAIGAALAFQLDRALGFDLVVAGVGAQQRFDGGCVAIAALVAAALFQYFYVRAQWRTGVQAQARAQIAALQARIRPHFLFNSMNTIASLIRTRPDAAERAVEDLSDLFRAALRAGDEFSRLDTELELARRYLDIEQLRLGERLQLHWDLAAVPGDLPVPALLLQPLVENAIHHGIQPLPQGGVVELVGSVGGGSVLISIRNPRPREPSATAAGNQMALDNIRQRLAYHYGASASLETEQGPDYYACRLRLPAP